MVYNCMSSLRGIDYTRQWRWQDPVLSRKNVTLPPVWLNLLARGPRLGRYKLTRPRGA